MCRVVPSTWILYGIAAAQLANNAAPLVFAGRRMTVSGFLDAVFDYQYGMRWWCVLIVAANMVFYRVASILVLRYKSFLKR